MLTNSFYCGRVRWNGVEHPGNHTAIVPEPLFVRVQDMLKSRHRDCGEKGSLHFLMRGVDSSITRRFHSSMIASPNSRSGMADLLKQARRLRYVCACE